MHVVDLFIMGQSFSQMRLDFIFGRGWIGRHDKSHRQFPGLFVRLPDHSSI